MKKQFTILVAALVMTGVVQAAGDIEAGKTKSAICIACHGADGNSVNPVWPSLAGQHVNYIENQLKAFKDGNRKDPLMAPMAAPLSDEDMANLAAFFNSLDLKGGKADANSVELGEKLFRAGNAATGVSACSACHGPDGSGNAAADFPRVSGQHAAYVEKALKDFRSGDRTTDMNKMMRDIAAKMTDEEIAAVSQYVQGLR